MKLIINIKSTPETPPAKTFAAYCEVAMANHNLDIAVLGDGPGGHLWYEAPPITEAGATMDRIVDDVAARRLAAKDGLVKYLDESPEEEKWERGRLVDAIKRPLGWISIDCGGLTALPEGLIIEGGLSMRYTQIARIPEGTIIGRQLHAHVCKRLTEIGMGLYVGDDFILTEARLLTALPDRLYVGRDFRAERLDSLGGIPDSDEIYFNHLYHKFWKRKPTFNGKAKVATQTSGFH
jgi:hypothetical protein